MVDHYGTTLQYFAKGNKNYYNTVNENRKRIMISFFLSSFYEMKMD